VTALGLHYRASCEEESWRSLAMALRNLVLQVDEPLGTATVSPKTSVELGKHHSNTKSSKIN
jgi:hypothetical protein